MKKLQLSLLATVAAIAMSQSASADVERCRVNLYVSAASHSPAVFNLVDDHGVYHTQGSVDVSGDISLAVPCDRSYTLGATPLMGAMAGMQTRSYAGSYHYKGGEIFLESGVDSSISAVFPDDFDKG